MLWRQGDVFIATVPAVPADAIPRPHCVLAEGEVTGHSHRVDQPGAARLFAHPTAMYLEVTAAAATIVHQEHSPVTLPRGVYRVWRQREYSPEAIRVVRD
ncbi:MAG TPA: hypothetical protein VGF55_20255 [Gemmataceae bacterium]|jgi:hypothetical protein